MKRTILGGIAAAGLFASSAFAAGFDVNPGEDYADISSGNTDVEACTDVVNADLVPDGTGITDEGDNDWKVGTVRITTPNFTCLGHEVTAALIGDDGNVLTETETRTFFNGNAGGLGGLIPQNALPLDVDGDIFVEDVTEVSILINEPNI